MSKDTCIKANTYCPVHKGIVGADCWHDSKDFSVPRTDWKQVDEIASLREQVKKLENRLNKDSQEFTILCAKETEKVLREQLAALAEQNEKMRKERETHLYLAEQNKQLKVELKSIDGALNDTRANLTLTTSEIIWELKEQNEKMRKALTEWRYLDSSYNWRCGHCGNEVEDGHKEGCALSLPNLATPVLNRIKAEAYREAADICSEKHALSAAEEAIRARAAELEKSNG